MTWFVDYAARFGADLPRGAFPLPAPGVRPTTADLPSWWPGFLDFVDQNIRVDKPRTLPPRSLPQSQTLAAVHARLEEGLARYQRYRGLPTEADTPADFPNGLTALLSGVQSRVLQTLRIARAEDWDLLVVDEYAQALQRCRLLCDAQRRGHLAADLTDLRFGRAHVDEVMAHVRGVVGVVDYTHVLTLLEAEADRIL